jgi:hypothetical protein
VCAVVASVAAGILPVLNASDAAPALRGSSTRLTGTRDRRWLRTTLTVAQTALCVALLVAGGLLVRADDSILMGATVTVAGAQSGVTAFRFLSAGALVSTFGGGGEAAVAPPAPSTASVHGPTGLVLTSEGKIVLCGAGPTGGALVRWLGD